MRRGLLLEAILVAWLVLIAPSFARTNDHCSCHSVKSKTFTRLMMREGHPRARPMDADDPFHPCRRGGPLANESWWSADHAAASEQLRQAEAGEAPLGGTARKHLGLS